MSSNVDKSAQSEILNKAGSLIKAGKKQEAKILVDQLLKENPENVHAWYLGAHIANDKEQSIKILEHILQIDPNYARARTLLTTLVPTKSPLDEFLESKPKNVVTVLPRTNRLMCPNCQNTQTLQKVSSIVAQQTSSSSGHIYSGSQNYMTKSSASTSLASKLAPPTMMDMGDGLSFLGENSIRGAYYTIDAYFTLFAFMAIVFLAFMVSMLISATFKSSTDSALAFTGLIMIAVIVNQIRWWNSSKIKERRAIARRSWENSQIRWGDSWYCHKCDSLFVEGENRYSNTDDFYALLGLDS